MPVLFLRFLYWTRRSPAAGISVIALLALTGVLGNAMCYMAFDMDPGAWHSIRAWGDALWYSVISITTIGYGDLSAASLGARLGTVFFIIFLGLTSFTLLLGMVADSFMDFTWKGQKGMGRIHQSDHILIVNFPSEARVRQILRELASDRLYGSLPRVLVTDQASENPLADEGALFIQGSPLDDETYQRAGLPEARLVLVLPISYSDPNSDAVCASIVSVVRRLRSDVRIVAECLDEKRQGLFPRAGNGLGTVVCGQQISGNLLVQELSDPGVAATMEDITSNLKGDTLYTTVAEEGEAVDYTEMAKRLLDNEANMLSVVREGNVHTMFGGLSSQPGDGVVYVATRRLTWRALLGQVG